MREVIKCKDAVKIWGPEAFCSGFLVIFRRCGSTYLRPWDLRPKCQMRSNTVSRAILIPATKDAVFETQCHLSLEFSSCEHGQKWQAFADFESALGACHVWCALWNRAIGLCDGLRCWTWMLGPNLQAELSCVVFHLKLVFWGYESGQFPGFILRIRRNQCTWYLLGTEHHHQGGDGLKGR